jgi:hypothetical protein
MEGRWIHGSAGVLEQAEKSIGNTVRSLKAMTSDEYWKCAK